MILAAFILILTATACVSRRSGVSWADMSVIGEENLILVSYNDFMALVNPANGNQITLGMVNDQLRNNSEEAAQNWEIAGEDLKAQFFASPYWLDDERMLILDYSGYLRMVNYRYGCMTVQTGACVTDNPMASEVAGKSMTDMVVDDGKVFIAMSEHDLAAYDLETFNELWVFETERGLWAAPVIVDGVIYTAGMDHQLYAVDAQYGQELWSKDLGGALASSPLYYDGDGNADDARLYVGSFGRKVFELNMNGEVLAEYETENWVWSTPVLFDDILYVTDLSGHVHALDTQNGLSLIWKVDTGEEGIRPSPLVTDQYVIVATQGGIIYWLDRATGTSQVQHDLEAEILSELLMVDVTVNEEVVTLLIVSTVKADKTLVAFTLDGGGQRWIYGR
jgi:outer membrane protein assembly factor BamB